MGLLPILSLERDPESLRLLLQCRQPYLASAANPVGSEVEEEQAHRRPDIHGAVGKLKTFN